MSDPTPTDLLPCPFCGSSDLHTDFHRHHGSIQCRSCECVLPLPEKSPETQAARWNERAKPDHSGEANTMMPANPPATAAGVGEDDEDDELDLYDTTAQEAIGWTLQQVGKFVGLERWDQGDGSESVEGDVSHEIMNIMTDAGIYDPEDGRFASLTTPASHDALIAHDCFECSTPLIGPLCPKCNPAHDDALIARVQAWFVELKAGPGVECVPDNDLIAEAFAIITDLDARDGG